MWAAWTCPLSRKWSRWGVRSRKEVVSGAWADIVVLDPTATEVLAARDELSETLEDTLFALMMLGDDRAVRTVYIRGETAHEKD